MTKKYLAMNIKKTLIICCIAALLSAIGVYFAFEYIQQTLKDQSNNQAQQVVQPVQQTILLVGLPQRILQGTVISAEHIQALTVPLEATQNADYVLWEHKEEIIGHRLITSLPQGAGLKYSDLVDSAYILFSDQLAAGERAITIPVDPLNSHYGFLQPNDRIDLFISLDRGKISSKQLLSNIEVLATDTLVEANLGQAQLPNSGKLNTITLRVNVEQAQIIALTLKQGNFTLLLRNQQDTTMTRLSAPTKKSNNKNKPVELIIGGQL